MNLKNRSRFERVTMLKQLPQFIFIALLIGLVSPKLIKAQQPLQQQQQQQQQQQEAQDSTYTVHKLVERTQLVFQNYPIEKVHMHFDKPYYAVGDTIWFKAYLNTNLYDYEPSKLIYVEMLSERDSLIQTLRVPMNNRNGYGQIILNKDWFTTGNYRVRAYTKWMANFDPGYFFNKVIPIGDVLNNRLNTKISFETVKSGRSSEKVRANLQFTDRAGNVFGNKRVNWEAVHQFDVLEKGKGETDAMGNISFEINVKDKQRFLDGRLNVSVLPGKGADLLIGDFPLTDALWDVDVQFFPEGGDLIANVSKKVAFKAVANNGLGAKLKGQVLDGNGEIVSEFSDEHAGMGYFTMLPLIGQQYRATITFENGQTRTVELPKVKEAGIGIVYVHSNDEAVQVAIVANENYLNAHRDESYSIIVQSNGHLCYAAQAQLRNESVLVNLPKERFPTGIAQVVLFNAKGQPISERLIFIETLQPLQISINSAKNSYSPKDLVELSLTTQNNDTTFAGNYSIAVVDESKVSMNENKEHTILSTFLLTSDLQGHVENPNYYFNPENTRRLEALDALLMTQGFKRYNYEDLIAEKYPQVIYYPEQGIELSGTLRLNNGRAVPNGGLLLTIPDQGFNTDVYTDANGKFRFTKLEFLDSARVTINARGNDNYRNMVIHMDQTTFPAIDRGKWREDHLLNIGDFMQTYLNHSKRVYRNDIVLEAVEVENKSVVRSHREYSSLTGLSMPDHQVSPDRLKGCTNLIFCLQSVLTGITYDNQIQQFFITRDYNAGGRIPVQFFVNGMAIDAFALGGVNVDDIEGIDIFLKDELGTVSRTYQNNGVVSIYTKELPKSSGKRMSLADIERMLPKANVVDLNPLGYVKVLEFYQPKYETPESKNTLDLRSTIYWNPAVLTDDAGKASVQFYNADGRGSYKVIVEGVDATGNFGRAVYRYNVN